MKKCNMCSELYEDSQLDCISCGEKLEKYTLTIKGITCYINMHLYKNVLEAIFDYENIRIILFNGETVEIITSLEAILNARLINRNNVQDNGFYGITKEIDILILRSEDRSFDYRFVGITPNDYIQELWKYYLSVRSLALKISDEKARLENAKRIKNAEARTNELSNSITNFLVQMEGGYQTQVKDIFINFISLYEKDIYKGKFEILAYLKAIDDDLFGIFVDNDEHRVYDPDVILKTSFIVGRLLMLTNLIGTYINVTGNELVYLTSAVLLSFLTHYAHDEWIDSYNEYKDCKSKEDTLMLFALNSSRSFIEYNRFALYLVQLEWDTYNVNYNTPDSIDELIMPIELQIKENEFAKVMKNPVTKNKLNSRIYIEDVDLMTGKEFEVLVSTILSKAGYSISITKESGDQGIDIVAQKGAVRLGVQTKCYSSRVGNYAVQEVVSGIEYYGLNRAMVVTNNYFTQQAIDLADANNVILWDREVVKEKLIMIEQNG